MARTTPAEVRLIMDNLTEADLSNTIIDTYILGANALVTKILGDDTTIGAVLMEDIERWFTAHMIASTRWRLASKEKVGQASVEYTGEWKQDLSSTPYGQTVKLLDTTGKMSNIGKRAASIFAVTSFE